MSEDKKIINDEELDQVAGGAAGFSLNDRPTPDSAVIIDNNAERIDGSKFFIQSPKAKAL